LKQPVHLGFEHFFSGRESLYATVEKNKFNKQLEYLEKQIKQLKQDIQDERNKNQKLI